VRPGEPPRACPTRMGGRNPPSGVQLIRNPLPEFPGIEKLYYPGLQRRRVAIAELSLGPRMKQASLGPKRLLLLAARWQQAARRGGRAPT